MEYRSTEERFIKIRSRNAITKMEVKYFWALVFLLLLVLYPEGLVGTRTLEDHNDDDPNREQVNMSSRLEFDEPRIISLFPNTGSEFGGTKVTIKGYGFYNHDAGNDMNLQPLHCCFNETRTFATYVSEEEIHCDTPSSMPGRVFVSLCSTSEKNIYTVTNEDINSSSSGHQIFTYTIMATVYSLTPSSGSGGNEIEITGSGFINSTSLCCRFNDTIAPATFVSHSQIKCLAPKLDAAAKKEAQSLVTVSNNGVDVEGDWASVNFLYYPLPTITSIDPIVAPSTGGTNVFVRGSNYPINQPALLPMCKFGDIIVNATVLGYDELFCTVPPIVASSSITMIVRVSFNGGYEFSTDVDIELIIHPPVQVFKAVPNTVPETGHTTIIVFGDHFYENPNLTCQFGAISVPASWLSRTSVNCTVPPPSRIGTVDLQISSNGQVHGLSPTSIQFTYIEAVTLTSIKPRYGPYIGGTLIHLFGTGFQHAPTFICRFGTQQVTAVEIINKTTAQCLVPKSMSSVDESVPIDISVNNGHDFTLSGLQYMYQKLDFIHNIVPRSGPSSGNTKLSIFGNFTAFNQSHKLCRFTYMQVEIISEISEKSQTKLCCTTPRINLAPLVAYATALVDLVDADDEAKISLTSKTVYFTYYPPIILDKLEPNVGSELGGTVVTVSGRFTRSNHLVCKFGDTVSESAHWISKNKIMCISPPATEAFLLSPVTPVTILTNGIDDEGISLPYQYIIASHASTVKPSFGSVSGGTSITVEGSGFPTALQNAKALCSFGKILVDALVLSESLIKCISPPSKYGKVAVSITFNNGHEFISSTATFTFIENPIILKISPAYITSGERTKISVVGENFYNDQLQNPLALFKFGNFKIKAELVNETLITFQSPPMRERAISRITLSLNGEDFAPMGPIFSIYPPPKIASVSPNFSNENGGTPIKIQGSGFYSLPSFSCIFKFGNRNEVVVNVEFITFSSAICITPPMTSFFSQNVEVELTLSGTTLETNPSFNIEYITAISIVSVFPRLFPKSGGSRITINGQGFDDKKSYVCKIDEDDFKPTYIQAEYFTNDVLKCDIPPSQHQHDAVTTTTISIGIAINEQFYDISVYKSEATFDYHDGILLNSVTPSLGSVNGGSTTIIIGENFINSISISCSFSIKDLRLVRPAKLISQNSISCPVPRLPDAQLRGKTVALVQASNNGIDFSVDGLPFHYQMQMVIESVDPILLEENIKSQMIVHGKYFFSSNELLCIFSNGAFDRSTIANFVSQTTIQCPSPSSIAPGTYALSVKSFNMYSANHFRISVYPKIRVTTISPPSENFCGGAELSLIGEFPNSTMLQCKFGNMISMAKLISNQEIKCAIPNSHDGFSETNATVSVSGNGREFTNFQRKLNILNADDCVTASNAASTRTFDILDSRVNVTTIFPASGTIEGGQTVLIKGYGFIPRTKASCRFGLKTSVARVMTSNILECLTPESDYPGIVNVDVKLESGEWIDGNLTYEYLPLIKLIDVQPKLLPTNERSIVHVTVSKIDTSQRVFCSFGIAGKVEAVVMSSTFISCVAPAASTAESFLFDVFIGDRTILSNGPTKLHFLDEVAFSIFPAFGQMEGNTLLHLSFGLDIMDITKKIDLEVFVCNFYLESGMTLQSKIARCGGKSYCCLTPNVTNTSLYDDRQMLLSRVDIKSFREGFTMTQSPQTFTYKSKPKELIMSLQSGDLKGGTKVALYTNGSFKDMIINADSLTCMFGTKQALLTKWISKDSVECVSPPNSASDGFKVPLFFAENGIDFMFVGTFTYTTTLSILKPTEYYVLANVESNIRLAVSNLLLHDKPTCMFEKNHSKNLSVPAVLVGRDLFQCSLPLVSAGESMSVFVSNNGQEFSENASSIHFVKSPHIYTVLPPSGISNRGTILKLSGTNFIQSTGWKCHLIGANYFYTSIVHSVTNTTIQCEVKCPKVDSETTYQLKLLLNSDSRLSSTKTFQCYPTPTVFKISPSTVYAQYEQNLEIEVVHFPKNHLLDCVFFGSFGKTKTKARNKNDSTITCLTPRVLIPGDITKFEISSRHEEIFGDNGSKLVVVPPIAISEVEKQVTIPGSGFIINGNFKTLLTEVSCRLGRMYDGKIERLESDDTAMCITPPDIPRANYTEVEILYANSVISSYQTLITIQSKPFIHEIAPQQVLRLFKTTIAVWGDSFEFSTRNVTCLFGRVSSPAFVISSNLIHCETPIFSEATRTEMKVVFDQTVQSNSIILEVLDPWRIHRIVPCSGSIHGGTIIEIFGGIINPNIAIQCLFGDSTATKATIVSNISIQCETPKVAYVQETTVAVSLLKSSQMISTALHSKGTNRVSNLYHFYDEGRIKEVKPASSSVQGGTAVIIKGSWSYNSNCINCITPICVFGITKTFGQILPSNEIKCMSPPLSGNQTSNISLRVSLNGLEYALGSLDFSYKKELHLKQILPSTGSIFGGTRVALIGIKNDPDFSIAIQCRFGNYPSMYAFYDSETNNIVCHTPAVNQPSIEPLYLKYDLHGTWRETGKMFYFEEEFTVEKIVSNTNKAIFIKGDRFSRSLDLICKFEEQHSTRAYIVNPKLISCSIPSVYETNSTYISVVLASNRSNYSSQVFSLKITPSATIRSIYPLIGPSNGGTLIKIEGEGFQESNDLLCWFDDHATTAKFISKSMIMCRTSGVFLESDQLTKSVSFSLSWGRRNEHRPTSHVSFLFHRIWMKADVHLNPGNGPSKGGTDVTVMGDVLTTTIQSYCGLISEEDLRISFDGVDVAARLVNNSIAFTTPSAHRNQSSFHHIEKMIPVSISLNRGVDFLPLTDFVMYGNPQVSRVNPQIIFKRFHSNIWVKGTDFPYQSEVSCQIGKDNIAGRVVSSSTIQCPIIGIDHNLIKNMLSDVSISFNHQDYLPSNTPILIQDIPVVFDLKPNYISGDGGTSVEITGSNFESLKNARCLICLVGQTLFLEKCTSMKVLNDFSLSFIAPAGFGTNIKLKFDCYDDFIHIVNTTLTYLPTMQLISIYPQSGVNGTTHVTRLFGRHVIRNFEYSCLFTIANKTSLLTLNKTSVRIDDDLSMVCVIPSIPESEEKPTVNVQVMRHIDESLSNKLPFYITNPSGKMDSTEDSLPPVEIDLGLPGEEENNERKASIKRENRLKPMDINTTDRNITFNHLENLFQISSTIKINRVLGTKSGSILGGTELDILGVGFTKIPTGNLNCWFGSHPIPAAVKNDTVALCKSPPISMLLQSMYLNSSKQSHWNVPLKLKIKPERQSASREIQNGNTRTAIIAESCIKFCPEVVSSFTYTISERILSINPKSFPSNGNVKVRIIGEGFIASTNLSCKVGYAKQQKAIFINQNEIDCFVPPATEALDERSMNKLHKKEFGYMTKTFVSVSNYGNFDQGDSASFSYFKEPDIIDIRPLRGGAGTRIYVSVISLPLLDEIKCQFGHISAKAKLLSPSTLLCSLPLLYHPASNINKVEIGISFNGYHFLESGFVFEYVDIPIVYNVTPVAGPSAGGNLVLVQGSNFRSYTNIVCRFDESFTVSSIIDDGKLNCLAPPRNAGKIHFSLLDGIAEFSKRLGSYESSNGGIHSEIVYSYFEDFHITNIFPAFGSIRGNTLIKISGDHFNYLEGLVCIFGKNATTVATFISAKELECYTPPFNDVATTQNLQVQVQVGSSSEAGITVLSASKAHFYTFTNVSVIENIYPSRGFFSGGAKVKVVGSNFFQPPDDRVICAFGSKTTIGHWLSSTEVNCVTPAMSSSSITTRKQINHIEISGPFKGEFKEHCHFKLIFGGESTNEMICDIGHDKLKHELMSLSMIGKDINVSSESHSENDLIYKVTFSMFGNEVDNAIFTAFDVDYPKSWQYKVHISRLHPPCCDVQLSLNTVDYFGGPDNKMIPFTFDNDILVTGILPSHGSINGGTLVTLQGKGFIYLNNSSLSGTLFCAFGTEYSKGLFLDQHHIQCFTPTFPTEAKVRVTIEMYSDVAGQGEKVESSATFEFLFDPEIERIFPQFLPEYARNAQWQSIKVYGMNFIDSPELGCYFNHTNDDHVLLKSEFKTKAVFYNSSYLECQIENNEKALSYWRRSAMLHVTTNGIDVSNGHHVEIVNTHHITDVFPVLGPKNGGTLVHVNGQNFVDSEFLACKFGNLPPVPGYFKSSNAISCNSPSFQGIENESLSLDVTNNGFHYSSSEILFYIHEEIEIASIDPAVGPSLGGTDVVVNLANTTMRQVDEGKYVCKFNETHVPAIKDIEGHSLLCTSPPASFQGSSVLFEISLNGVDFSASGLKFEYLPGLERESVIVLPSHGPKYGGTIVKIFGSSLLSNLQKISIHTLPLCKFGNVVFPSEGNISLTHDHILCSSPDSALNENRKAVEVDISVTGQFEDFMDIGALFYYDELISIGEVNPAIGPTKGGTPVQIRGGLFPKSAHAEILCRFCNNIVPATWKSAIEIVCVSPKQPNLNETKKCILSISLNNGVDFSDVGHFLYEPQILLTNIHPYHGFAGTNIAVTGRNFSPNHELLCHFGESTYGNNTSQFHTIGTPAALYLSRTHIICIAPPQRQLGLVPFYVSIDGIKISGAKDGKENHYFHYDNPVVIREAFPSAGPASGNFSIKIFGGPFLSPEYEYCCRFGSKVVDAFYVSEKEIRCIAPSHTPGIYPLKISQNGQDYYDDFETIQFYKDSTITRIYPISGPAISAGTTVKVSGENFLNTTMAICKFNNILVPVRYLSQTEVECLSPTLPFDANNGLQWESLQYHTNYNSLLFPEAHMYPLYLSKEVNVEISMNAQDFTNSGFKFVYQKDIVLLGINIAYGPSRGGTPIFISGFGFVNTTSLSCRFGHSIQNATFLTRNLVLCFSPPQSNTYKKSDVNHSHEKNQQYLIGPKLNQSSVYVEISNNAIDFTDYQLVFEYKHNTQEGFYQPGVEVDTMLICPKGSYCSSVSSSNFTLCPKGTFQSLQGQQKCSRCPIGFICPEAGLPVPRICPSGFVCDVTGIEKAVQPCPAGFFCPIGTVTTATYCGQDDLSSSIQINSMSTSHTLGEMNPTIQNRGHAPLGLVMVSGGRASNCWDNSTEDYGLQVSPFPSHLWDELRLLPLDLNSPTVPLRGRFCEDDSCIRIQPSFSKRTIMSFAFNHSLLRPQRPIPCPSGSYCHPGTSNNISTSVSSKYSSPQQCAGGRRYCPEASTAPLGLHKCPTGYYCRFGKKTLCPIGTYCSFYDMWDPLPCQPGTYNHMLGQKNCTQCPKGHFCNGYGRVDPSLCLPGYVCSRNGLASPNVQCPSGYYCPPGTQTSDPFRNDTTLRPYPCSPGTYCLSGVAFPNVVEGNFSYAQPCPPGFYCESASNSATGSGLCPPGFYCPKGTATPRPTPKGHYAELYGMVKSSTCLPGYYAPTIENSECIPCPPGTSCETEGLFAADVCPPGSFRSTKEQDDITCQTCPQGTWSKNWHLRDQLECTSCPPGSYCPIDGMTNPCSKTDLPMPFEPVLNLNGVPVLEYKYKSASAPPQFSIDECLQLNYNGGSTLKHFDDQQFFFGELVPPYIDILGRGAHIRITDKKSSIYGKGVQCYQNSRPRGSILFERMVNYHGPQYDIQRVYPYQGYGSEENENPIFTIESNLFSSSRETSYLHGLGMMFIDLPQSKHFDPFLNCTHGFMLMNSTLKQGKQIVYTNANYDYEGGRDVVRCSSFDPTLDCFIDPAYELHSKGECCDVQKWTQRAIYLASDQYYPGTCEADIICNEERASEALSCQDGFVCAEKTTSESSTFTECPPGYVCSFGTTPDASLIAPKGLFATICPAGFFCDSGTGLNTIDNKCPVGYLCPSGTSNPFLGLLANDGLNRYFEIGMHAEENSGERNLVYFGGDQFQLLSDQASVCLRGNDPNLHDRYILMSAAEQDNSRSWISKQQNNFTTTRMTTKFRMQCARDNKRSVNHNVIQRGDCDCNSQMYLLFAVYRLWECSIRKSEDTVCIYPDAEIISAKSGKIPYISEHIGDGYGGRNIHPKPRSILPFQSKGFLKLRNYGTQDSPDFQFMIKFENGALQVFKNYRHLSEEVTKQNITDMDDYYYDLYHVVQTVEKYGEMIGDLIFFRMKESYDVDHGLYISMKLNKASEPITLVPIHLDVCNCKNALKCPRGSTTISNGSTDRLDCIWNGLEKIGRISLLPSTFNQSASLKNSSNAGEIGADSNHPIETLVLNPYEVAVFDLNFTGLPRNMTYGQHFQVSIYEDCKPCPPGYQCKKDSNNCHFPPNQVQFEAFRNCLKNNRKEVCVLNNATTVAVSWCKQKLEAASTKEEVKELEAKFLLYTEPDMHKCVSLPLFCVEKEWKYMTYRKLCQDDPNGPIYDCIMEELWAHFENWRDQVCCSKNPELGDIKSCTNNTCSNDISTQRNLEEKFIREYVIENGFEPPLIKPKGKFLMDKKLQEDIFNPDPFALFNKWDSFSGSADTRSFKSVNKNKPGLGATWKITEGCCTCKSRYTTKSRKKNVSDSGFQDDKHRQIKLAISAFKKVELTVVVELLHGAYYRDFSSYFRRDENRDLNIHKPSRFQFDSNGSTWLAIIEKATIQNIPSSLPLNLPIQKVYDDIHFEKSFLVDEPCENLGPRQNGTKKEQTQIVFNDDGRQLNKVCLPRIPDVIIDVDSWWNNKGLANIDSTGSTSQNSFLALPYLPFFSSCNGFDSHIGISRLLEEHPDCSLIAPEVTQPVQQSPFMANNNPIGDVCMVEHLDDTNNKYERGASLHCQFEEEVTISSNTKYRWFEAGTGTTLFHITSDPIPIAMFQADSGDGTFGFLSSKKWGTSNLIYQSQKIPVTIDGFHGGLRNAIPRRVLLHLQYYQVDRYSKRLVEAKLSYFDLCTTLKPEYFGGDPVMLKKMEKQGIYPCETDYNGDLRSLGYEFEVLYEPLDWFHLLNRFQFGTPIYLGFYTLTGLMSIILSSIIWALNKAMTKLRHPPKFRGTSLFKLIASPSIFGCSLAALGILFGLLVMHVLVNVLRDAFQSMQGYWFTLAFNHDYVATNEKGRSGLGLMAIGYYILLSGASLLIPEKRYTEKSTNSNDRIKANNDTVTEDVDGSWKPRLWKRMHFIFYATCLQILLLVFWEYTYSPLFSTNWHYFIIIMKIFQIFMEVLLMDVLREKLLCVPLLALVGLMEVFIAMGASNFVEFIITYFLHVSLAIVHKIYVDPTLKGIQSLFPRWKHAIVRKLSVKNKTSIKAKKEEEDLRKKIEEEIELRNEGVDPLIDALTQSSIHMIGRYLSPLAFLMIHLFYDFSEIAKNYGINGSELSYYALFAFNMIPWTIAVDTFVLNSLELVHGWRLYDYLEYQRHRFCSREKRWTLGCPMIDESVTQNLQSIDSMSFSSQYYFVATYLSSGMFLSMLGVTILLRTPDYNVLGDPAMPLIVTIIFAQCKLLQIVAKKLASVQIYYLDWRGIWGVAQLEGTLDDVIAAKLSIGGGRQLDLEQERMELEAMNDETFRKRFLDRNRPWILQHLYELFTASGDSISRSLDGSTLLEHAKQLYSIVEETRFSSKKVVNNTVDVSSDDESADEAHLLKSWASLNIERRSQEIAKLWLKLARKRKIFSKVILEQIDGNINSTCTSCSRNEAMCHSMHSYLARNGKKDSTALNDLITQFEKQFPSQQNDLGLWKAYFRQNAEIVTLCNFCIKAASIQSKNTDGQLLQKTLPTRPGDISSDDENDDINTSSFPALIIDKDSVHGHLVGKWLNAARLKLGGRFPRPEAKDFAENYISQMKHQIAKKRKDFNAKNGTRYLNPKQTPKREGVQLDEPSKTMIIKWLATAKQRISS